MMVTDGDKENRKKHIQVKQHLGRAVASFIPVHLCACSQGSIEAVRLNIRRCTSVERCEDAQLYFI